MQNHKTTKYRKFVDQNVRDPVNGKFVDENERILKLIGKQKAAEEDDHNEDIEHESDQ